MHRTALALLTATSLLALPRPGCGAEEIPGVPNSGDHGMDIINAAKTVKSWFGPGTPPSDKPWANDLAGITDSDPRIQASAIRNLVTQGRRHPEVLTDLAVLATDKDWKLRGRVLQVTSAIGGTPATPLLLAFSKDSERRIRELAAFGLANGQGPEVLPRLVAMLQAPESEIRQAAAASLGTLGEAGALEPLTRQEGEADDLVKREMRRSLARLCADARLMPAALELFHSSKDAARDALLEAVIDLPDPRMSPGLAAIAADPGRQGRSPEATAWTQFLAVRALAVSGDYRAVPTLISLADSEAEGDVQKAAATALRLITGYGAAPGKAWRVWISDNQAKVAHLAERDAYLAELHAPEIAPDPARLAAWSVDELDPLLEAVLGRPAGRVGPQWPARALAAIRADAHGRWIERLVTRLNALPTSELATRLGYIVLLDDLVPTTDVTPLVTVVKDLKTRMETELAQSKELKSNPPDHGPEITLLTQALARRGVQADL
jgi:HEAT repeat protein